MATSVNQTPTNLKGKWSIIHLRKDFFYVFAQISIFTSLLNLLPLSYHTLALPHHAAPPKVESLSFGLQLAASLHFLPHVPPESGAGNCLSVAMPMSLSRCLITHLLCETHVCSFARFYLRGGPWVEILVKGIRFLKFCQLLVLHKVWLPMGKTGENSIEATYPCGRVTHLLAHLPCVAIVKQF